MLSFPIHIKDDDGSVYLTITLSKGENYLLLDWKGKITDDKVKEGAKRSLEIIQELKCMAVLNDNRKLSGNWSTSNDWLESYYFPKALELGLRFIAHVFSPNFITKFSSIDLETRDLPIEFKTFDSMDSAGAWLDAKVSAISKN